MAKEVNDIYHDFRFIHAVQGELAAIARPHITSTDLSDPAVNAHKSVLRSRALIAEALDRMEGNR